MKVLVTGANGFVGQWLVRRLLDLGHSVRVLVRRAPDAEIVRHIETVFGDISDPQIVTEAARDVEVVYHLAGVVGYSKAMRAQMYLANVTGTKNMVDACVRTGVRRLVHMSSVVAIGASFDEHHVLNEESKFNLSHLDLGYFETKREAEEIVINAVKDKALDAVCVNPSTIYGAGDATKGSRNVQKKVARGKFPFYTGGGVNVVHVEDVIEGIVLAAKKGVKGERYILAGENLRIRELFEIIAGAAGVKAPRVYLPNPVVLGLGKIGDFMESKGKKGPINTENAWASILYHWFDNSKAQKDLGFKARPSEEAITESVKWMKANGYA